MTTIIPVKLVDTGHLGRAVLRRCWIAQDAVEGVKNPVEARLIEAVEVLDRSRCVLQLSHGQQRYDGRAPDILLSN